jgi:hypothetical protein
MPELAKRIADSCGVNRGIRTMRRMVSRAGLSYKKAFGNVAYTHKPEDVLRFCRDYEHADASGSDLICIDEAGFYVGDHSRRGYATAR